MISGRKLTPLGYAWIIRHYGLSVVPHWVESFATEPGVRGTEKEEGRTKEYYPKSVHALDSVFDHLEFALKREGLNLPVLRLVLPRLDPAEVLAHVRATPTGANVRRLAFLYESFSGKHLDLPDMTMGNYVPLAEPELYFTGPDRRFPRWRINQNLLHTLEFSPMLRRTETLAPQNDERLRLRAAELIGQVPADIFQRALRYLYAKETRTSYAIESETPTQQKAERFMDLLRQAGSGDWLNEKSLVALQNAIVDPRFAGTGWRDVQNYVGRSLAPGIEEVHLVPPRPADIAALMTAWLETSRLLCASDRVPPIAAAALVAWWFVYLHPFEDGNDRIHRFLIHHVLAARRFGPAGVLLPVSAVLLNRPADYDASLEVFSVPLKACSDYELDDNGVMTVTNHTLDHFRHIDFTPMAEALHGFMEETIEKEMPLELRYLRFYDDARAAMRDIVELPETTANLFLKLCRQNQGRLSQTKRQLPAFAKLTDEEISRLENAVANAYAETIRE